MYEYGSKPEVYPQPTTVGRFPTMSSTRLDTFSSCLNNSEKLGYWRLCLFWLYTYTQWECGEDKRVEPLHWVWQASAGKLWQCRSKCSCTVLPQARNPENQKERWVFHGWPLCSEKSPHGRWHRQVRCQSSAREEASHWERDITLLFYSNVVKNNKYNMTTT